MISVSNVSVLFGGFTLFEDISFVISARERVALVGKNGAGKSTLLKIISGSEQPTSGGVHLSKGLKIGYLPQVMKHEDGYTILEECTKVFDHITELQKTVDLLAEEMAERTDYDSPDYLELIELYSRRSDELSMVGAGNYQSLIERTLLGLGFERDDFNRPSSSFSGGWRMRIELAKILLQSPDLLLLDEPTNHLDIESIRWLERFVVMGSSAMLLISHDKAFLDATTTRTIEIEHGRLYDYKTNYSHYVQLRAERLEHQRRAYENQQKSIQATEDFIERFRYKPTKSNQVQSRIKQLEKIERIELDEIDRRAMHFSFTPAVRSGAFPIVVDNLRKDYGSHTVFSKASFTIKRGEKVAFVGKNGAGKSTMIKCLMGEINDYSGTIELGHMVEIGYFAQTQAQDLDGNLTVFDTIDREATGEIRTKINDLLGAFMFGGELSQKKVSMLSGGERSRLAIIKLLLRPSNLLILDEPTNHLDIRSKEVLKEAIDKFDGTVIVVSHDREFLDGLVSRIFEFGRGEVREYMGGIYDWLQHREQMDLASDVSNPRGGVQALHSSSSKEEVGASDYQRQKEESKKRRAIEREVKAIEERIEAVEAELHELESLLSDQANATDSNLFERYERLKVEQTELLGRWEQCSEDLDGWK